MHRDEGVGGRDIGLHDRGQRRAPEDRRHFQPPRSNHGLVLAMGARIILHDWVSLFLSLHLLSVRRVQLG